MKRLLPILLLVFSVGVGADAWGYCSTKDYDSRTGKCVTKETLCSTDNMSVDKCKALVWCVLKTMDAAGSISALGATRMPRWGCDSWGGKSFTDKTQADAAYRRWHPVKSSSKESSPNKKANTQQGTQSSKKKPSTSYSPPKQSKPSWKKSKTPKAVACGDLICGKWRVRGTQTWTIEIRKSRGSNWEFESVITDPGGKAEYGYRRGMVVGRFNKTTDIAYAGEVMRRKLFTVGDPLSATLFGATYSKKGDLGGWHNMGMYLVSPKMFSQSVGDLGTNTNNSGYRIGPVPKIASRRHRGSGVSTGTGFFINHQGYLITNNHVIDGCGTIKVVQDGIKKSATVVSNDSRNDLAVLKVPFKSGAIATFRGGRSVRTGADLLALGFPLQGTLSDSLKITKGMVNSLAGLNNDTRMMQISTPVQPGNSGGPLLDQAGNVVGVVTGKLNAVKMAKYTGDISQNVNFAIKASLVRDMLEVQDIDYETASSKRELKTVDIFDRAKKFTVLVECLQ